MKGYDIYSLEELIERVVKQDHVNSGPWDYEETVNGMSNCELIDVISRAFKLALEDV